MAAAAAAVAAKARRRRARARQAKRDENVQGRSHSGGRARSRSPTLLHTRTRKNESRRHVRALDGTQRLLPSPPPPPPPPLPPPPPSLPPPSHRRGLRVSTPSSVKPLVAAPAPLALTRTPLPTPNERLRAEEAVAAANLAVSRRAALSIGARLTTTVAALMRTGRLTDESHGIGSRSGDGGGVKAAT